MTKLGKALVGMGSAFIVYGGLGLSRYSTVLGTSSIDGVFYVLLGVAWVLIGVGFSQRGVRQKVIRGLSIGFAGAALALIVIYSVHLFS
jgi:hypothetical protein